MPYTDRIDAGTVSGIRLYLTRHFEHNGKHYYYLSRSGLNNVTAGDQITGVEVDNLFNPGGHTIATQEGNHDGSEDERSIIVSGGYRIILPTQQELRNLFTIPLSILNYPDTTAFRSADYVSKQCT